MMHRIPKFGAGLVSVLGLMALVLALSACAPASPPAPAPAAEAPKATELQRTEATKPAEQQPQDAVERRASQTAAAASPAAAGEAKPTEAPAAPAADAPAQAPAETATSTPAATLLPAPTETLAAPTAQTTLTPAPLPPAAAAPAKATVTVPPIPTLKPFATDTRVPVASTEQPAAATAVPTTPTPAPATATSAPAATLLPAPTETATNGAAESAVVLPDTTHALTNTTTPPPLPVVEPTAQVAPTALVTAETRVIELEWPENMRLGETDIVRLALVPDSDSYTVTMEFPGNTTVTKTTTIERIENYDVFAVARLDGAGFVIAPNAEQSTLLPPGQLIDWRWSISAKEPGQQRLAVLVKLRWVPVVGAAVAAQTREANLYSKGFTVQVTSVLGMSASSAMSTGMLGLLAGVGLAAFGWLFKRTPQLKATVAQVLRPNAHLKIEPLPSIALGADESALMRVLFGKYSRVAIENEFRSGYSGARTFLAHPIREDGRADAYTIAKIGSRESIEREFDNYQRFVKDTLPPITARIQEPPVTVPSTINRMDKAVLRYTFIGEQGRMPVSLREAVLHNPIEGAALLQRMFETFGPNWWMQRRPYVFRLAIEYDRMLPAHFVIEPVTEAGHGKLITGARLMDARKPPEQDSYRVGDVVVLQNFGAPELRADGRSVSLTGVAAPGQPPIRVRWAGTQTPLRQFASGAYGRIVGTRETLLQEAVRDMDLHGLPDPIKKLPVLLNESVPGTQATIHGDLNLENALVGPGGFVWLIDFAQTRDGHTLYDFAHLEAEIIAHVIAPQLGSGPQLGSATAGFVAALRRGEYPLLNQMRQVAAKCLFNHTVAREYDLALYVTCLGATKYANLTRTQQHLLYLTAAHLAQSL